MERSPEYSAWPVTFVRASLRGTDCPIEVMLFSVFDEITRPDVARGVEKLAHAVADCVKRLTSELPHHAGLDHQVLYNA
jgi:hypothetical protein